MLALEAGGLGMLVGVDVDIGVSEEVRIVVETTVVLGCIGGLGIEVGDDVLVGTSMELLEVVPEGL